MKQAVPCQALLDLTDHADLDAGPDPVLKHPLNEVVAHLRVVDQELLSGLADERGQQLPRRFRADDEAVVVR